MYASVFSNPAAEIAQETPLRILHCLRTPVGGLFRHVIDLAREQAGRGHKISLICDASTGGGRAAEALDRLHRQCGVEVVRLPMSRQIGARDITAYLATRKTAALMGADIVHGHGAKGGAYARLAARSLKRRGLEVRAIYTPHGGSLHYDRQTLKGRIYHELEERLADMGDGLIFESAFAARVFADKIGAPRTPCRIIANGIGDDEFAEHRPRADAVDFLFVGELRLLKGVDILLQALAEINRTRSASTIIVGAGADRAAFERQARDLGLEAVVRFAGAMPAREAFPIGRAMVVPSRAESLPYIVLEAAAATMPLIMSDVGGIPEIVEGTDIALVPPGDAAALARSMDAFLDAPDAFLRDAARLRERIGERFTLSRMTDDIIEFYREII